MKKISLILLTLLMTLALTVSAAAFETYQSEPDIAGTEIFNYSGDMDYITSCTMTAEGDVSSDIKNLSSGGSAYCCKMDSYVMYEFEAPGDGVYTFCLGYIARVNTNRGIDYSIDDPNGTSRVYIDLAESDEEQFVTGTFELTAGTHQFYVYAPTAMDDDTLKSCDIYNVAVYFTEPAVETTEAAAETEAPAADTEAETAAEAAVETPAAAQTADMAIAVSAVALLAACAIVVSKKRA